MKNILSKKLTALIFIPCFLLFSACSKADENTPQSVDQEATKDGIETNEIKAETGRLITEKMEIPSSTFSTSKIEGSSNFVRSKIDGSSTLDREIIETLTEFNAEEVDEGTMLTLPEDILFDFDSADLRSDADEAFEKLVRLAEETEGEMTIIGHTDSHGEEDYNQQLSENRAEAVLQALVDATVDEQRLKAEGKGATEPIAENTHDDGSDNPEGRQENRRVEIILHGFTQ